LAAQENAIHDSAGPALVFAASRYAQTIANAPAAVTVITRQEIESFGWRTLAEVLGATGGFFSGYDRNYTYVTARGLAQPGDFNTRLLVMVNGHRVNGAVADDGLLGLEGAIPLEAVERVEIIRGPGSSLFGTNALYGVVNVVTRQGSGAGGFAAGEYGTFETWRGGIAAGTRLASGLDLFGAGALERREGPDLYFPEFDDPATNDGLAVGVDGERTERGYGSLAYGDFRLEGLYSSRRKEIPTASFETTFNDPRAETRDDVAFAAGNFEHAFENLSRLWASVTYNRSYYWGAYPYDEVLFKDAQKADVWTVETQYMAFVAGRHKISAGGEVRWQARLDQEGYDEEPYFSYLDDQRDGWVLAGFAQAELQLASRVSLYAGVRHDWYESIGGSTNPRGALVVGLGERSTLKALYGRAFRAPNPYELYYNDDGLTQKAPGSLDPETIQTFELVLDRAFTPLLRGAVSAYHMAVDNLVGLTTDPADSLLVFANLDEAKTTGVEAEVVGRVVGGLWARASYAYQYATREPTDEQPAHSPRHVAHLGLTLPLVGDRVRASGEVRVLSGRPTLAGAEADAHALVNLVVLARPSARAPVEVMAGVRNLLDTEYADPGGEEHVQDLIPQDGRTFRVGLRLRLGGGR
jgi:iron complex outermembrane receptor protein